ncbi:DNA mismatch repair protein MutL [Aulographum hederae CBS 113979]|uniref:DNA mismatch repair protein MutL n=1 Tax=Aulographum hederae CBS 113979 TaxID=1176131 RepID=A0A6G1GWC5_9PEZI|nr:DNA mismatch repair protein MutL [Aulographum hederae CBS 113979]
MDIDEPRASGGAPVPKPIPEAPRRIQALSSDVVNKIAAGEIIVAPCNALKELIENSVDAGSTSIEILAKDGGLKLLQITDNGHGIDQEDMPILCKRHTTSKLKTFEDLSSIGTYGFRGEALASISYMSHLTVTTKIKESSCAWKARYAKGELVPMKPGQTAEPKPTAGRQGTQITVEDLFFDNPNRRKAFRSASEEYAKILDVVGRHAIHCSNVAFTCKKHGESSMGISVPANASTVERVRQVHGSSVANELIKFEVSNDRWGFKSEGWISNANYSVKRTTLLLFINHRSVESSAIKKGVEQTYATFLPKGGHPFVYLSLEIDPRRVDVNVHPTKREVGFLNEEEIVETICDELRSTLGKVDSSRTFMTQSLLTGPKVPMNKSTSAGDNTVSEQEERRTQSRSVAKTSTKPYENNLVRTDSKVRKITSMLPPSLPGQPSSSDAPDEGETRSDDMEYQHSDKQLVICKLATVKSLRAEVRANIHNELADLFSSHTFVGIVDERRRIAAVQGGVRLYLVDYGMVCNEYFYQVGLTDFGNFGAIRFNPVLDLHELLSLGAAQEKAMADPDDDLDWDQVVQDVKEQLINRRAMLEEYFSLEISKDGELLSLPLLMKGYTPSLAKLPQFLLRLGPQVNWTEEKECFQTFLKELANFYVPEVIQPPPTAPADGGSVPTEDPEVAARRNHLHRAIENVMFPAFKARLVATGGLLRGVIEIAHLKGLYRMFERC